MTVSTSAPAHTGHLYATLGPAPDGSPVRVHANGNILIQGCTGSGKTVVLDTLAMQWLEVPGMHVMEIRCTPRNHQGRYGWYLVIDGRQHEVTYDKVRTVLVGLAATVAAGVAIHPTVLLIEELRPTDSSVVEAVATLLEHGTRRDLHVAFTTYPLPELLRTLRPRCRTRIFMDPLRDHTVQADDAVERARKLGLKVLQGPGSFIVANDRCDVGMVAIQTAGEEAR